MLSLELELEETRRSFGSQCRRPAPFQGLAAPARKQPSPPASRQPRFDRSAWKSGWPSSRRHTASPSSTSRSTGIAVTASTILGKLTAQFRPLRVQRRTPLALLALDEAVAVILEFVNPRGPARTLVAKVGRQGRMKPAGERRAVRMLH